jgi:NAD(P) transhydrogenase subunit beta
MPIISSDEAANIVFLRRSVRPGFAGIDSELHFYEKAPLLLGNAKDTLCKLVVAVKDV